MSNMRYKFPGGESGANWTAEKTAFRVWAPGAESVDALLYMDGHCVQEPFLTMPLKPEKGGAWTGEAQGNHDGRYYVYRVRRGGAECLVVDPYAVSLGVNGLRGMILDLRRTDPVGFKPADFKSDMFRENAPPVFTKANKRASPVDAVIYELHLRDISAHPESGIAHKGKFLGLAERGAKDGRLSTGLDHICALGVTHVHILPAFDFKTVDEASDSSTDESASAAQYNWGYDPANYNAPEGSYSTDPFDGAVRVREFKEMVGALHKAGLRVVMDVVYNHVFSAAESAFEVLAPGVYFRHNANGGYSNGSGCGNETASEHPAMRAFIVSSVCHWAREYHIDGFRFDLMALHDVRTMNKVRAALDCIDPSIIIYGEGWTAGETPLPQNKRALKENAHLVNKRIAFFLDDMRDGLRGSVWDKAARGFVSGGGCAEDVKFGIAGSVRHPGVDISKVRYSRNFWAASPTQTVNYVSCHDNLTLWDKLKAANPEADEAELVKMNKLAAAVLFTSQGIPFFQAGEEFARTKGGDENSYKSPDSVNAIDWTRKERFASLASYYAGLIKLRAAFPAFRLTSAREIRRRLRFLSTPPSLIAYLLKADGVLANGAYSKFVLLFNGGDMDESASIPKGAWDVLVDGESAGTSPLRTVQGGGVTVTRRTALVLGAR